ncbi:PEPxxWA-CTERM sorting domain-containing protein [Sphingomonas sp. PAMC 26617]|uniref:PEPxxWA-CTERM sorting domain-containing protein n=1 Tax=Sphingomonas sp. PAMC 26617 TaxID=1112216 RepID=UPI000288084A|nr:PEPxxWA-CTERM sorting domain-containing protein [Sphingomonas sp. PAMC 26617]
MRFGYLITRAAVLGVLLATAGTAQAATSLGFDFNATNPYRISVSNSSIPYAIRYAAKTFSGATTPYTMTLSFLLAPEGRYCGQLPPGAPLPSYCLQNWFSQTYTFNALAAAGTTALSGAVGSSAAPLAVEVTFRTSSDETFRVADFAMRSGWNDTDAVLDLAGPAQTLPEPATWGMLLVGFGAIGSVLRSRRQRRAPVFA